MRFTVRRPPVWALALLLAVACTPELAGAVSTQGPRSTTPCNYQGCTQLQSTDFDTQGPPNGYYLTANEVTVRDESNSTWTLTLTTFASEPVYFSDLEVDDDSNSTWTFDPVNYLLDARPAEGGSRNVSVTELVDSIADQADPLTGIMANSFVEFVGLDNYYEEFVWVSGRVSAVRVLGNKDSSGVEVDVEARGYDGLEHVLRYRTEDTDNYAASLQDAGVAAKLYFTTNAWFPLDSDSADSESADVLDAATLAG